MATDERISAKGHAEFSPLESRRQPPDGCPEPEILKLLKQYPGDCRPREITCVGGAGGFSGAQFWRLSTDRGLLCLRRWPVQSDPDWPARLRFIHDVLERVAAYGRPPVPAPIRNRTGETYFDLAGHLWELAPWMPGAADYFPLCRVEKLRAALTALAEFHRAAAECRGVALDFGSTAKLAPSPGINRRHRQIDMLRSGRLSEIAAAVEASGSPQPSEQPEAWELLRKSAVQLLPLYRQLEDRTLRQLVAAESEKLPMQACIRDIWHAHVLFEGDRVSALIDFGAMRVDNVACDVARLLESMADDDSRLWQEGLAAYTAIRVLSDAERRLIVVFDHSTTLLSGINWLEWLFVERRTFDNLPAIAQRMAEIVRRMTWLVGA
jgi:Ser/Thr protein kinase RdoA (MazF antagonist)